MAKIKQVKLKLGLNPSRSYEETNVAINYDATTRATETYRRRTPSADRRFYIKLPRIVADALGETEVRGADQYVVLEYFMEKIEKFKTLQTEERKIIIYHIDVDPKPGKEADRWGSASREIKVWAQVYTETKATAGDGSERYSYEAIESPANFDAPDHLNSSAYYSPGRNDNGKRHEKQILWTKDAEAFFVWIRENMDHLIARLDEIDSPDKMLETIQAGRLLPLGESK